MRRVRRYRSAIGAVATLLVVYGCIHYVVTRHRRPGSMTVLEAQAMDMSVSGTPRGIAPVVVETVRMRPFSPTVTYTGTAVAYSDEDITARVTGRLLELSAYPGQRVEPGQVLGRLDTAELDSRLREADAARQAAGSGVAISQSELGQVQAARRAAQARLAARQAALEDARAQVSAARAMAEEADRAIEAARAGLADALAGVAAARPDADYWGQEMVREKKLLEAHAVSREEFQREEAQAGAARARLAQAQAAVQQKRAEIGAAEAKRRQADAAIAGARARAEQSQQDVEEARADLAAANAGIALAERRIAQNRSLAQQAAAQSRTAGIVRDYTTLTTSSGGVVAARLVSPGTLVQPGMAILRIEDDRVMRLQASVAEADLTGIRVGYPVIVTAPGDDTLRISARVTSIFGAADAQTRTTVVEALAPNQAGRLRSGQYVTMQIATGPSHPALTVPLAAVRRDANQKAFVWTMVAGGRGGKTLYTCVMHPEVQSEHPGKCPKCGMDLVPERKGGDRVAHRVFVTLGARDGRRVVVTAGLREGDTVIVGGLDALQEGDPVSTATSAAGSGTGAPIEPGAPRPSSAPDASAMPDMPGMPGMPEMQRGGGHGER